MQLITPQEAAEQLGVSLTTVKAWMNRERDPLPTVAVGVSGKHRRVLAGMLFTWLEAESARKTGQVK